MTPQQRRESPRDDDEAAAFKGLGRAVTLMRERKGMARRPKNLRLGMVANPSGSVGVGRSRPSPALGRAAYPGG